MSKKIEILISVLFFTLFLSVISSNILTAMHTVVFDQPCFSIRLASIEDLESMIELDTRISYEYFKPLFLQYCELGNEEDVEKLLVDEIEYDTAWFASCIAMEKQQRLYVAHNDIKLVGFVACHEQEDTIIMIDLLMIDADYRAKGIGKQLIKACIQTFPQASTCMLVVLDKNQQAKIAYEKMGFVLMDQKPSFVQEKYPAARFICYKLAESIRINYT